MNFLSYPFPNTSKIIISNEPKQNTYIFETAKSSIEIFQSLCYRKPTEFNKPLVLIFDAPHSQNFSMIDYKFNVEQIFVNYDTGLVNKFNIVYAKKKSSLFIQGYSEFSMVLLAPIGFVESQKIKLCETKITSTY